MTWVRHSRVCANLVQLGSARRIHPGATLKYCREERTREEKMREKNEQIGREASATVRNSYMELKLPQEAILLCQGAQPTSPRELTLLPQCRANSNGA
eukprot:7389386-Prymnesium_polylepis.1